MLPGIYIVFIFVYDIITSFIQMFIALYSFSLSSFVLNFIKSLSILYSFILFYLLIQFKKLCSILTYIALLFFTAYVGTSKETLVPT